MIYTKMTNKALKIAADAHKNQFDKAGIPYILHPFYVAEHQRTEETTTVALLHDVIEDSKYTLDDLRAAGFPESVVSAVELLTKDPNVPYMDYIKKIGSNKIATAVKVADLSHNLEASRIDKLSPQDIERMKKYRTAKVYLTHTRSFYDYFAECRKLNDIYKCRYVLEANAE